MQNYPLFYKLRMHLFGKKYTKKERFINIIAFLCMMTGAGIAASFIFMLMGISPDTELSFSMACWLLFYISLYILIGSIVSYYIVKFFTDFVLFIYGILKFKLTGRHHIPDNHKY